MDHSRRLRALAHTVFGALVIISLLVSAGPPATAQHEGHNMPKPPAKSKAKKTVRKQTQIAERAVARPISHSVMNRCEHSNLKIKRLIYHSRQLTLWPALIRRRERDGCIGGIPAHVRATAIFNGATAAPARGDE